MGLLICVESDVSKKHFFALFPFENGDKNVNSYTPSSDKREPLLISGMADPVSYGYDDVGSDRGFEEGELTGGPVNQCWGGGKKKLFG